MSVSSLTLYQSFPLRERFEEFVEIVLSTFGISIREHLKKGDRKFTNSRTFFGHFRIYPGIIKAG